VLINLLDNAVKYGPTGQTITVALEREQGGTWARLWVEDEGPGIPIGERARIWEPFHRLERDSNSAIAGSGIGLALVRTLTAAHAGRVTVEDGLAGGSRFVVEIPCDAPTGEATSSIISVSVPTYAPRNAELVTGR
jgi:signal transduction histidine kinase